METGDVHILLVWHAGALCIMLPGGMRHNAMYLSYVVEVYHTL
jgi:hypothetical protein